MSVLDDDNGRRCFRQAWEESLPATSNAHEEGGFVLKEAAGSLSVERWPRGLQDQIRVPPHGGGRRGGRLIVATFHRHPNPGPDYQQAPGLADIRAVRDDADLHHREYEGEYVIASETLYRVLADGSVEVASQTRALFGIP